MYYLQFELNFIQIKFSTYCNIYFVRFSLDEMDLQLNQISDLNTRIVDLDRLRKQLEADRKSVV